MLPEVVADPLGDVRAVQEGSRVPQHFSTVLPVDRGETSGVVIQVSHQNLSTTQAYMYLGPAALEAAISLLNEWSRSSCVIADGSSRCRPTITLSGMRRVCEGDGR
jgi:hypothetical protein